MLRNGGRFTSINCLDCNSVISLLKDGYTYLSTIALEITKGDEEVMVIGGASLCKQLLPKINRLYITKIDGKFEGDVFFPEYDDISWHQVSCESHPKDDSNAYSYHFIVLDRIQ